MSHKFIIKRKLQADLLMQSQYTDVEVATVKQTNEPNEPINQAEHKCEPGPSGTAKPQVVRNYKTERRRRRKVNPNASYVGEDEDVSGFSNSSLSWAPSGRDSDSDYEVKPKKKKTSLVNDKHKNKGPNRQTLSQTRAPDISFNINSPSVLNIKTNDISKYDKSKCADLCDILTTIKERSEWMICEIMKIQNTLRLKINANGDSKVSVTNKNENILIDKNEENQAKCKNENGIEMVKIGNGNTIISKDDYERINWTTFAKATRCLLKAVFPRSVLATHSLTGKPSPAFKNKEQKMPLDAQKVLDIVKEVCDRFHTQESFVRGIITTTCADESKMCRTRQFKMKQNISRSDYIKKASPT